MKTHPCSRCRRLLPSAQIADTCSACRAKVKARRDKNLMRTSGDGDDKKIENHENIHANANAPGRKLHVAKKVFRKDTVNNSSHTQSRVSDWPEYQTSEALYANLSSSSHRSLKATYSIVSTASTPITLERRVVLVSRALRAELEKNEGGFDRARPLLTSSTSTSHSKRYACKCGKGPPHSTPSASGSTVPLKRPNDITRYLSGREGRPCGGEIEVTVEEDTSHWLGIKAHRVTIRIEHKGSG